VEGDAICNNFTFFMIIRMAKGDSDNLLVFKDMTGGTVID